MSTKVTISHDKNHHLYQEIFDVSYLYLRVSGHQFEARNGEVMVQIPIKAFRSMIEAWKKAGWPESEDNSEAKIADEWLNPPPFMGEAGSDETVIFQKVKK